MAENVGKFNKRIRDLKNVVLENKNIDLRWNAFIGSVRARNARLY